MIRVLVVDDHAVVRIGIEQMLANVPDVDVLGGAADGEEAVARALAEEPDVVMMDLSMPGVDGVEATKRILTARPATHVVILTSFSDRDRILAALDAGADGYLLKDADPEDLVAGIRAAARGEAPLAPKAAREVLTARTQGRPEDELSQRELEVLRLVAAGLPNKRIARELGISEKTVKTHLTRVFRHIGVDDRTQAALWAQAHGLVRPPND